MKNVIAYDLGTGGIKASLYNQDGKSLASTFKAYDTSYPAEDFHEQRPDDWWEAVVATSRQLIEETKVDPATIEALAISGHSLGVVALGKNTNLVRQTGNKTSRSFL